MAGDDAARQLGTHLRAVQDAALAYDSGDRSAAGRIAAEMRAVFHQSGESTSLLARLLARLTKVATTVGKPPYPRDGFSPLASLRDPFHAESFVIAPLASGPMLTSPPLSYDPPLGRAALTRQVPATEWWASEPVVVIQGRKVTRKDVVLWATEPHEGQVHPAGAAFPAVLRQMAYEVSKSPELAKLAGR